MAESLRNRIPSLLSLGSNSSAAKSTEDLSKSPNTLRPQTIPRSRDPSPNRHQRIPSLDLRGPKSAHSTGPGTGESTPRGHFRLPSLGFSHSSSSLTPGQPPAKSPAYGSEYEQSPSTPGYGPQSGIPPELRDTILMPPPPIGGSFSDRVAGSPTGSRNSSRTRGRPGSSAGIDSRPGSRANSPAPDWSRPGTPTDAGGKLAKKRTGLFGKSHNRTDSGSSTHQGPPQWAFIVGPQVRTPYDTTYLLKAQPVRLLILHQRLH